MLSRQLAKKDAELIRLARSEAQLKLRIGECLDALYERDGHRELGFSSLEAYVLERCERSSSWTRDTRGLARRLRERGLGRNTPTDICGHAELEHGRSSRALRDERK